MKIKILYRYLTISVLKIFLALIGIFSVVIVSSQLLHLPSIMYHVSILDFIKVLILVNFSFFKFILIFSFFISTALVGYNLRENREIYAIYSLGISQSQLLKPLVILSILITIFAFITSFFIVPTANRERAKFITLTVREYFLDAIQEKNFSNISANTIVYVEKKEKGKFENLLFFNKKNNQIITSKEAYFKSLDLHLKNGYIQIPTDKGINLLIFNDDKFKVNVDYLKNYEIEDFENEKLIKIINENLKDKYKALSVIVERLIFPIPFLFIGVLGFLIGLKTIKGKDFVLSIVVGISIVYIFINFYLIKLISKGTLNPIIYFIVITAFFGLLTYYFIRK